MRFRTFGIADMELTSKSIGYQISVASRRQELANLDHQSLLPARLARVYR